MRRCLPDGPSDVRHRRRDPAIRRELSKRRSGAAAAGALMLVPLYGSGSALDVARALPGAVLWLQVYLLRDRERSLDAIRPERHASCAMPR